MTTWGQSIKEHPIRFFALICVAATSIFLMVVALRLLNVLSSPDWCSKAIQAERITPGNTFIGLTACIDLLKLQLGSISIDSHIVFGSFALCLLVLIVVVIAGGKVDLQLDKTGGKIGISRDSQADTLDKAGDALKEKAAETEQGQ